eukprot:763163-Hanusia_phi.AAC.5
MFHLPCRHQEYLLSFVLLCFPPPSLPPPPPRPPLAISSPSYTLSSASPSPPPNSCTFLLDSLHVTSAPDQLASPPSLSAQDKTLLPARCLKSRSLQDPPTRLFRARLLAPHYRAAVVSSSSEGQDRVLLVLGDFLLPAAKRVKGCEEGDVGPGRLAVLTGVV